MINEQRRRYVVKANNLCTATICVFLSSFLLEFLLMWLLSKVLPDAVFLPACDFIILGMSAVCILLPITALILRLYARKSCAASDKNFGIIRTVIACGIMLLQILFLLSLFSFTVYEVPLPPTP